MKIDILTLYLKIRKICKIFSKHIMHIDNAMKHARLCGYNFLLGCYTKKLLYKTRENY